ncbi:MAG: nuclear transport factor 2 family protein [Acidobacteria bacterium]|nr:nuclear transport factor 2 family protein [Acidobacteriota bacterium]
MKTSRREIVASAGGGLAALAALGVTGGASAQGSAVAVDAELLAALRDCVDKMAIKELFGRYAHAIDTGDAEGWAAVFTEDGQYELFGNTTKGRPAIAAAIAGRSGSRPHSQHRMVNHVISIDGDTAHSVCEFCVIAERQGRIDTITAGFYEDDLRRVDGQWLIARRQIQIKTDPAILQPPEA